MNLGMINNLKFYFAMPAFHRPYRKPENRQLAPQCDRP